MSMDEIKVVVDAQGGDNAPGVVLEGVAQAVAQDPSITVILTGAEDVIVPFAAEHANVVAMDDYYANYLYVDTADSYLKTIEAKVVFTDMGANADCKPEYLVQFARMARVYAQVALGVENPSVGLLNIGEEETKGSEFAQECHKLMKEHVPNFKGNAEGGNLALGGFDVIVTDGFTGNVALKVYEGVGKALLVGLKETIYSTTKSKIGGLLIKDALSAFKEDLSADKYGGAQLLGCKGVCLIGHGSSNAKAICSGVLATADAIRQDMPKRLAQALAGDGVTEEVL